MSPTHIGVLKLPESLKLQHLGESYDLEQVAKPGNNMKGAVGNIIDKIYYKDRRMVNNAYKGNMLATAVLTDMGRYHKIKSSTGVESRKYQENIKQELASQDDHDNLGINLDILSGTPKLPAGKYSGIY